jgi:Rhodanese-like domain
MADTLRITVDELRRRMEAGEDFTIIDVRNPQTWAQSDVMLPEAIRVPLEKLDENLPKVAKEKPIVIYCTDRMKDPAPVWRRNYSNTGTRTRGLFKAGSMPGAVPVCRCRRRGRPRSGVWENTVLGRDSA